MNDLEIVEQEASTVVTVAQNMTVKTPETYQSAADFQTQIRVYLKKIDGFFNPMIAAAHKTHVETLAKKKEVADPFRQADHIAGQKMKSYYAAQERQRREEQAKLQAEAKRQEEDRQIAMAAHLERAGDQKGAEAILETPAPPPPVIVPSAVPTIKGTSYKKAWTYTFVDPSAVTRDYLVPDEKKIAAVVRAFGREAERMIGGITVTEDLTLSRRID